jgi:HSP20 family molecular chaperone IbpA
MAPFDHFLPQLGAVLRPVHVTLTDPHPGLRSLVHKLEDPYYSDKTLITHTKHHDVFSPNFDVREDAEAFFLEGEFPGVSRKEDILIEKLGPRTLLVETRTVKFALDDEWDKHLSQAGHEANGHGNGRLEGVEDAKEGDIFRTRLSERHVGHLQRSFTFPSAVDIGGTKARLRHGLLVMRVPKVEDVGKKDFNSISIED